MVGYFAFARSVLIVRGGLFFSFLSCEFRGGDVHEESVQLEATPSIPVPSRKRKDESGAPPPANQPSSVSETELPPPKKLFLEECVPRRYITCDVLIISLFRVVQADSHERRAS